MLTSHLRKASVALLRWAEGVIIFSMSQTLQVTDKNAQVTGYSRILRSVQLMDRSQRFSIEDEGGASGGASGGELATGGCPPETG